MHAIVTVITGATIELSIQYLRDAFERFGCMRLILPEDFDKAVSQVDSELVVIDATYVVNPEEMVDYICKSVPGSKVVVVAASPTWQQARSVFEAGAKDYLSKTMPVTEFCTAIDNVFRRESCEQPGGSCESTRDFSRR
jgi:DNA-binding NarL/FixJ family response regulator